MHVKSGDTVIVISGKDKGKIGKIIKAMPKENSNRRRSKFITRHMKPRGAISQVAELQRKLQFMHQRLCTTATMIKGS